MAKAFTDINQSRKLAEILPPESAAEFGRISDFLYEISSKRNENNES